jgi:HD-GYP domain-containing protein (c-di-GMP phosphodiesterase class II)
VPDGLVGEAIPFVARIAAVADSFDAMTSDRPYRHGLTLEAAVAELIRCAGTQYDPRVVEAFGMAVDAGEIQLGR